MSVCKEKELDISNLENALEELSGADFALVEKEARMSGDITPEISQSGEFRARLAAKALRVPAQRIKSLSIKEYMRVTTKVSHFLFDGLVEEVIQQK